jgi:hypothetical protein
MLLAAAIHPAHGIGLDLCFFHRSTGVACPGCGLVRSVSCTVRGDLRSALTYHAFGPLITLVVAVIALAGSVPPLRRVMTRLLARYAEAASGAYWTCVAAFIAFGVLRALMQVLDEGLG